MSKIRQILGLCGRKVVEFKKQILKRDEYKCKVCGTKLNLVVHHKIAVHKDPIMAWEKSNCITLCKPCHNKEHQIKKNRGKKE